MHIPREQIEQAGGQLFAPSLYFGVFLDIPPITALNDRARSDGSALNECDERRAKGTVHIANLRHRLAANGYELGVWIKDVLS